MFEKLLGKIFSYLDHLRWKIRYKSYRNIYQINDNFIFNGPDIRFYGSGEIILGRDSHIGSYSTIQSANDCIVLIGNNCRISHNVRIYTKSDIANQDFSQSKLLKKIGNVTISDNVWIGVNTYIGPNVKIGINSVISANSLVTKDIPDNCIAGGVPAKIIKYKQL